MGTEYTIVSSNWEDDLIDQVNSLIREGWEPHGQLWVAPDRQFFKKEMVRHIKTIQGFYETQCGKCDAVKPCVNVGDPDLPIYMCHDCINTVPVKNKE